MAWTKNTGSGVYNWKPRRPSIRDAGRRAAIIISFCHVTIATLILALASSPVYAQGSDTVAVKAKPKLTSKTFTKLLFAKTEEIALMSHDGRWEGVDNDLELRLRRDGTVLIIDYGYGISKTRGKYKFNSDGMIVISPIGTAPWLPMPCAIEKGFLAIRPPGKKELVAAARKAGIAKAELTDESYRESYEQWPLRQIIPKGDGVTKR